MIEVGQFCYIKCSRYVDYGIKKGDLIYVAGDTMVAIDEGDPYLHRKIFLAARTDDGHVDAKAKALTVDGVNLKPVSKSQQKKLYTQLEEDFKKAEES